MIEIQNLSFVLGSFSLKDITLSIGEGEYFMLLGPSGAGKSLLLECLSGIRKPSKGRILMGQKDISKLKAEQRGIGYVPQGALLFPHMEVIENIKYGLKPSDRMNGLFDQIVNLLNLRPFLYRRPQNLSTGEKQRVAMARALASRPSLLLMDEPFSAIDPGLRQRLWTETLKVHRFFKTTVIHVTHDMEEAFTMSHRLAVLCEGKIEQAGPKEEVFQRPRNEKVARFLGIHNIFTGRVIDIDRASHVTRLACPSFEIQGPFTSMASSGEEMTFCIPAQEIKLIKQDRPIKESLMDNLFDATIVAITPFESVFTIYASLEVGGQKEEQIQIKVPIKTFYKLALKEGKKIRVAMRKGAIHFFEKD